MTSPSTSRRAGLALGSVVLGYLLIGLVAGTPDSPLVPVLPEGVRRPGWTTAGSRWIGLDRLTRTELTVLSIVLIAAILVALFVVLLEARRGRLRVAPVFIAAAMSLTLSVAAPVVLSRDVYSYAAYGRMYALHHANPFVRTPSEFPVDPFVMVASPAWIDTRAVYGPAFVLAGGGISRVWAGSPGGTILAFKVLAGMGALLATVLAASAAGSIRSRHGAGDSERRPEGAALAAAAVGLNPVMVVHTVGGAHNDALIAACLAGALVLAVRWAKGEGTDRDAIRPPPLGVTVLLTLAGLIKVVVLPVLLVWLWILYAASARNRRTVGVAVHGAVAVALSLALSAPFLDSARALSSLLTLTSIEGWASPARLVARGARALGDAIWGAGVANGFGKFVVVGFLALFAAVLIRFLRRPDPDRSADAAGEWANAWALATVGLALSIPYLLPWYAAWFLPFLAVTTEGGVAVIGLAVAGLLALTGIPAEPGSAPDVWRGMVVGVHYVIAPIMLALFLAWLVRALRIGPRGPTELGDVPRMTDRARP